MNIEKKLAELDQVIASKWREILSHPQAINFASSLMGKDRRIYALYLTQVYYYTFHTAKNQALVAVNPSNTNIHYMKFCLEHALEETGHELMALSDLRSIGVPIGNPETDMPPILPPTELLVAYLYWISGNGNPVQRLGYSYWAEQSYGYIQNLMELLSGNMGLEKKQMTFYFNHSNIDEKHAKDVQDIIAKVCKTEKDWEEITKVALTTLDLTNQIIFAVIGEYQKLVNNEETKFSIIDFVKTEN